MQGCRPKRAVVVRRNGQHADTIRVDRDGKCSGHHGTKRALALDFFEHSNSGRAVDKRDLNLGALGRVALESTHRALNLAHRAVAKFPELKGKYAAYAGAAAVVSSAATLMAAIAISRKMKRGMSADKALASLTAADIENALHVATKNQRYKRLIRKIVRRRDKSAG